MLSERELETMRAQIEGAHSVTDGETDAPPVIGVLLDVSAQLLAEVHLLRVELERRDRALVMSADKLESIARDAETTRASVARLLAGPPLERIAGETLATCAVCGDVIYRSGDVWDHLNAPGRPHTPQPPR